MSSLSTLLSRHVICFAFSTLQERIVGPMPDIMNGFLPSILAMRDMIREMNMWMQLKKLFPEDGSAFQTENVRLVFDLSFE